MFRTPTADPASACLAADAGRGWPNSSACRGSSTGILSRCSRRSQPSRSMWSAPVPAIPEAGAAGGQENADEPDKPVARTESTSQDDARVAEVARHHPVPNGSNAGFSKPGLPVRSHAPGCTSRCQIKSPPIATQSAGCQVQHPTANATTTRAQYNNPNKQVGITRPGRYKGQSFPSLPVATQKGTCSLASRWRYRGVAALCFHLF